MYADTGLMHPYFQNLPQEVQQFDEFFRPNPSSGMASRVAISENNIWGGDLFQAPQLVIEEPPVMSIDPMMAAISMISCGDDIVSSQSLAVSDIESSIESGQILSEVFYECRKDLLEKEVNGGGTPLSDVLSSEILTATVDVNIITEDKLLAEDLLQKSISSSGCCLNSMDCLKETSLKPNFVDFPVMDLGAVYGMRRAFSEGDIQTLGHGSNINFVQSQMELSLPRFTSASSFSSENRREKLSRYRSKKSKRNFDRKIKYACRKALADSQPRIRGRFAKTEEPESSKKQ